jgi:hypothetical protein
MSQELLEHAQAAIDDDYTSKTLRKYLKDNYNITSRKEILFFIEFLKGGVAYKAYQQVYAPTMKENVARVMASKLVHKYNISFMEWLDYAGHGTDSINEA